jgi:hypothetical protein
LPSLAPQRTANVSVLHARTANVKLEEIPADVAVYAANKQNEM